MQPVSPDELLAEASQMALELRFKDRLIGQLRIQCQQLAQRNAALQQAAAPAVDGPGSGAADTQPDRGQLDAGQPDPAAAPAPQ